MFEQIGVAVSGRQPVDAQHPSLRSCSGAPAGSAPSTRARSTAFWRRSRTASRSRSVSSATAVCTRSTTAFGEFSSSRPNRTSRTVRVGAAAEWPSGADALSVAFRRRHWRRRQRSEQKRWSDRRAMKNAAQCSHARSLTRPDLFRLWSIDAQRWDGDQIASNRFGDENALHARSVTSLDPFDAASEPASSQGSGRSCLSLLARTLNRWMPCAPLVRVVCSRSCPQIHSDRAETGSVRPIFSVTKGSS